jgi:hypothetical protein
MTKRIQIMDPIADRESNIRSGRPRVAACARLQQGSFASALVGSLAILCACFSAAASAQSGSSLFAVGETGPSRPAARQATPPAKPAAVAAPAKAAAAAPRTASTRSSGGKTAAAARTGKGKPTRVAAGKPRPAKVAARSPSPVPMNGRWQDSDCIPLTGATHRPALFVKRQYEFDDARRAWELDATVYSSDSCAGSARLLTYHGAGSYAVTGKSRVASNAYDASFKIDRWTATPESRDGVMTLLNGRCGSGDFAQGRALDLSASGCPTLGIRSLAQSPREVELVSVSNGKFFLGSRAFIPGFSEDRPAQLSSYGLTPVR